MAENEIVSRKVLIIGVNSYIGRNFIHYCKESIDGELPIHIEAISGKNGEWKQKKFDDYQSIILLSGIVHTKAEKQLYYEVNYKMAVEVAKRAKEAGVLQFVFMSTIAVYGDSNRYIRLIMEPTPTTDYAKSKRMAEIEIQKLECEEFRVAIVRPPMVYGPGCPGNFTRLVKLMKRVQIFPMYKNHRSAIYIDNLCEFLRQLVINQERGVFVPQNAEYLSSLNIAIIMRENGYRIFFLRGLSMLISIGMKMNDQLSKLFGNYIFEKDDSVYENMEYQKINMKDSIQKTILAMK